MATVADLPEAARKAGIRTPAIIVVGKVCSLAERFGWYEKLPLAGVKAVVTRPRKLVSSMAEKLRTLGAEVLELPAISVEPVKDRQRVLDCLARLEEYQWLVFTSPSGVDIFFDEFLRKMQKDVRALGAMKIAALGGGTARALRARGIFPDLMPQTYDGASLGQELARVCEPGRENPAGPGGHRKTGRFWRRWRRGRILWWRIWPPTIPFTIPRTSVERGRGICLRGNFLRRVHQRLHGAGLCRWPARDLDFSKVKAGL